MQRHDGWIIFDELSTGSFTCNLSEKICMWVSVIQGDALSGLISAAVAVEADTTAVMVSESMLSRISGAIHPVNAISGFFCGQWPRVSSFASIVVVEKVLPQKVVVRDELAIVEGIEVFVV